jgi:hypothetical protein
MITAWVCSYLVYFKLQVYNVYLKPRQNLLTWP